ncbi:Lrp/AsnC family transcriptional regulator [Candidatus Woesearchaeota archaeon]|nr:Lrp/AsnC family transcriptional regulator [Candidatus Woesearchaeota archaeon]
MGISELDKAIINLLLNDSRLSYRNMARKAGVSVATVMNHVKAMEKAGVIKGYTAVIDHEKIGFDVDVLISIKVSKGKLFNVENKIASSENVFAVYDVTGDYDAVVLARFKNRRSLDSFLKKIQTLEFVERTNTVMVLNTIKDRTLGV